MTQRTLFQTNVNVNQGHSDKAYGTEFNIPVVYYSTLMPVASDAALAGQTIHATKLKALANK